MWICKQCKSEVEDSFEVCWNCECDRNGTRLIFQTTGDSESAKEKKINSTVTEIRLKPNLIAAAGKAIKAAVYAAITNIVCLIIALIVIYTTKDKGIIFILGLICVFSNVYILIKFYIAGDFLENS